MTLKGTKLWERVKQAELLPNVELQPHQQRIAETGLDDGTRMLLYHGLGTGKSLSAISAAEASGEPYTAVVPASLRPNFRKEREKFTDQQTPADVLSYNAMARGGGPDETSTLIVDEAQRIRNDASQQTQAVQRLAENANRVYLLSGTPIVNRPGDLAPLVSILTQRQWSPQAFEDRFVGKEKVSPGILGWLRGVPSAEVPAITHEPELRRMLAGHVDYQGQGDHGIAKNEERYSVAMSPEQTELYQAFWNQLPWLLRWKMQRNFPLTKQEIGNLSSFLAGPRQVGLSTLPFMKGKRDPLKAFQQSPKLQKAMELVEGQMKKDPNFQGAAFSNFIDAGLEPYAAALADRGIPAGIFHGGLSDAQRKQMVADYNSRKLKMFLYGPSGGEGISLKGTKLLQVLDPHWNEARTTQAIGRGIRFDSHQHLPVDQRQIAVQRFASELPPGMLSRLWRRLTQTRPDNDRNAPGTDVYLERMAQRKNELNEQFLQLLREVGSKQ